MHKQTCIAINLWDKCPINAWIPGVLMATTMNVWQHLAVFAITYACSNRDGLYYGNWYTKGRKWFQSCKGGSRTCKFGLRDINGSTNLPQNFPKWILCRFRKAHYLHSIYFGMFLNKTALIFNKCSGFNTIFLKRELLSNKNVLLLHIAKRLSLSQPWLPWRRRPCESCNFHL